MRKLQPLYTLQIHDLHTHVHAELLEKVTPDQLVHELLHIFTGGTHKSDQFRHLLQLFGGNVSKRELGPYLGGNVHSQQVVFGLLEVPELPLVHHVVLDPFEPHVLAAHHGAAGLEVECTIGGHLVHLEQLGRELFRHPHLIFEQCDNVIVRHQR